MVFWERWISRAGSAGLEGQVLHKIEPEGEANQQKGGESASDELSYSVLVLVLAYAMTGGMSIGSSI